MKLKKVSIIILIWNGLKDTIECLESVKKMYYPSFEIIVIDNASNDGSPETIKERYPDVTLIRNKENLGFVGGNNIGIKYALSHNSDYIWMLNNDTVVEPNSLSEMVCLAENELDIGILSPVVYHYHTPSEIQYCGSFVDWRNFRVREFKSLEEFKKHKTADICLWGTALLIKSTVVAKIGYLNKKFFAYHEDIDYSLKALKSKYRAAIVPTAKVYHKYHNLDIAGIQGFPPHYFFYTTRNLYWLWRDNLKGLDKINFLRKYLARTIQRIGYLSESNSAENIDASIDGVYCALLNVYGKWNTQIRIPKVLKKLILWHPFALANLLNFDFSIIIKELLSRIIYKFKQCQKSAS